MPNPKQVMSAMQAIAKAAESSGQKAPVTANKPLTGLQDFHTSLLDKVRENAVNARKEMDAFDYQYDKGQRVFTDDSAKKNRAPYEILERYRHGNQVMRADHPTLGANMGQPIRDPDTGKAMRTPYEAGYRVRGEIGEMIIPESAIKGAVDKANGGAIRMQVGGLGTVAKLAAAEKVAPAAKVARGFTPKLLESTTSKMLDDILEKNPKLTPEAAFKKARDQAEAKLTWERETKPALVKQYGPLARASYEKTKVNKMQNTDEAVQKRIQKANEFLDQPTEPWTPPKPELQAFDRSSIKDALEGFPRVEQSAFPRDIPTRASTSHVEGLYTDPVNRELIKKQINRGLPLGGETFYGSLYPIKQAVLEAGMPAEKFDKWVHSLAPASARNSIINETAVGQFLRDMNARGIPLTEKNVAIEMAKYKQKFGVALPLMPVHRQGVANVLEGGQDLREMSKANIPTNYKIPTYGAQKTGDFGKSVVLDVHEAAGQTQGSRYHPYFKEQGGFGNTEYNAGEQGMMGIAEELGIPGGMAQAGRWFGGGELTGLKSPRGDALDILERQVAYTLKQQGKQPNPAMIRNEILNQIKTGEGQLLPWYKSEGIPDVRETGLQRKKGGSVEAPPFHDFDQIMKRKDGGTVNQSFEQQLMSALANYQPNPDMLVAPTMASGGTPERRYAEAGSVPAPTPQELEKMADAQGAAFGVFPQMASQRFQQRSPTMDKASEMLKAQVTKEWEQAGRPGGAKELSLRIGAVLAGQVPDLVNFAQSVIPSLNKPASVLDPEGEKVARFPMSGTSTDIKTSMREKGIINEDEYPLAELAGVFGVPYAAVKAPSAIRGGLNMAKPVVKEAGNMASRAAIPIQRPFTPATFTVESTADDLGQGTTYGFRQGVNDVLLGNPNLGTGRNKSREAVGTFMNPNEKINPKKEMEINPMRAIDVRRAGTIGDVPTANQALRQQVGQLGEDLNQTSMAGHRFLPLMTNNIKDASSMLIKTQQGLSKDEIRQLATLLGNDMVLTHNPKLGGVVVMPFGRVEKGQIPEEFLKAQSAAGEVLGKRGKVQFGVSDYDKDRLFMEKSAGDYTKAGAKPMSKEQQATRQKMQGLEKFLFPESRSGIPGQVKAAPVGGLQPWSVGSDYPTNVIGIGNGSKVQYQPRNFSTGQQGSRYDTYMDAEQERAQMLDEFHRTLVPKYR